MPGRANCESPIRRCAKLVATMSLVLVCGLLPTTAEAQYFGRNKVQYDRLAFRVMPTDHFRIHFYPAESLATVDAARMAERWYSRLRGTFNLEFDNNPLIFYADAPDFQQTNVIEGEISQGTGGVTEGLRERVIMPFTGSYAETEHVLGHELVHVFQYRLAATARGGIRSMDNIPLWLIEGMAEYLSLGREDPNTAMWLRDALRRNDLPTLDQLTRDPRYFPYRYGQALWAYIGGTWGDQAVGQVFKAALDHGWNNGVAVVLGVSADTLSAQWHNAIRNAYSPMVSRAAPADIGRGVAVAKERGEYNISPAVSPDGRLMAYFSSRGLFGVDLYVADVSTGRVIRQLTSVTRDAHFDALSFLSSAGAWSPDASQLAFVSYVEGDHEITIVNARNGDVNRRIKVAGVTAMSDPAWSPDGARIAFSGSKGGISDLYVYDLRTGSARQLTDDREAQLHPAWSPDNSRLAYVTDADPNAADFTALRFAPMRLAMIDVERGAVQLLPRSGLGKHINPQFSPDGRLLYYVADHDGVSDVYVRSLATGDVRRLTGVATGVSGISTLSPAISVARGTGALLFSVFDNQGFSIRMLDNPESSVANVNPVRDGRLLPPANPRDPVVDQYLDNYSAGLPPVRPTQVVPYRSSLKPDYVGMSQVGISAGGANGAGLAGGVAFSFSDELGNKGVQAIVQANGQMKDIGGQVQYLNRARRWNWGITASHVPSAAGFATTEPVPISSGGQQFQALSYTQVTLRQYYQTAQLISQYPLSNTRRIEVSAGAQRIAFGVQIDSALVVGDEVVAETRRNVPAAPPLNFATASAAFVGDYSIFGFTSPVAGGRYRFELSPGIGSMTYTTALLDYRRYMMRRPFTLAVRGLHVGRYGGDAENDQLSPLFVGQPHLVRGYDPYSFSASECMDATATDDCAQISRLSGSRMAVLSAEFRIPLFGTREFGIIPLPFLPLEVSPFVDAGLAWSKANDVSLRFARQTADRVPVVSAGVSGRINLLGYAVLEVFWARPFQRPSRSGLFGFQLQPGW